MSNGNQLNYPESCIEKRKTVDELVVELSAADVISFDIFDTLLFRALADPKDLFIIVGNRLNIPRFYDIRIEAEKEARKRTNKNNGEINIFDIYRIVSDRCGVDIEEGIKTEILTEMEICFANPYIKQVVNALETKNKTIIATSNMYLSSNILEEILSRCGYKCFKDKVFVSCDYQASKTDGRLYRKIESKLGLDKSYVHIGDNYISDFVGARMVGWHSCYYKGVNEIGKKYRPANMSRIGGSIYSGIVNAKLHNGLEKIDPYYEFGYVYGGIIACGFCKWINEFVKKKNIDLVLFSGRDMYSIYNVYNKYYCEIENKYISISRFAAQRFSFDTFSEYFIASHVKARAGIKQLTIKQVFEELELGFLLKHLDNYLLDKNDIFTTELYENVSELIRDNKTEILLELSSEKKAAIKYYQEVIGNNKRIAIVDLGWQGTNTLCLKSLINKDISKHIEVYSLLVCAAGINNTSLLSDSISKGETEAFCCSPQKSPNLLSQFIHPKIGRFLMELLFTSNEKTLKSFFIKNNNVEKNYFDKVEKRDETEIDNILKGIQSFVNDFNNIGKINREVVLSGWECLLPINKLSYNQEYSENILKNTEVNPWIGDTSSRNASSINTIVR